MQAFTTLNLKQPLLDNIAQLGYTQMMPIQAKSLPLLLQGKDVIAQAKTGSGKTAAFGLSILNNLVVEAYATQALIVCPTRELAEQVCTALRQLARMIPNVKALNLSGGIPMRAQIESLKHSPHIVVGTPGRILKHLQIRTLNLYNLQTLVLDEADKMLDMGFLEEIENIIARCPADRQSLLFSATFPCEIKQFAGSFMQDPQEVTAETTHDATNIQQVFYEINQDDYKLPLLKELLYDIKPSSAVIFCNTKQQTTKLAAYLNKLGFSAAALNGDMEQSERNIAIVQFRNKSRSILIATDVAARGLDIKDLPLVINFDLAFEHETHIHRIGRTGRGGEKGIAVSMVTPRDGERLCTIEDHLGQPIPWGKASKLQKNGTPKQPEMVTLRLSVGRKNKIRPGDILGALTKDAGFSGKLIGKIDIEPTRSYVAVHHSLKKSALAYFRSSKVKGCKVLAQKMA